MHIYFLVNPKSGNNKGQRLIENVSAYLKTQSKIVATCIPIDFANLQTQIEDAKKYQTIVICGGDGTLSSLIGHLAEHPRVGFVPLGTANDFAIEIGLPKNIIVNNPEAIIDFFSTQPTKKIHLGLLEYGPHFSLATHFVNYISFGYDAKIVRDFSDYRKTKLSTLIKSVWINRLVYTLYSIYNFTYKIRTLVIIQDNTTLKQIRIENIKSIIGANISSMLGLGISNPYSSPFNDSIEIVSARGLLDYISMMLKNSITRLSPKCHGSFKSVTIFGIPENCPVQIDGESRPDIDSRDIRLSCKGTVNIVNSLAPSYS